MVMAKKCGKKVLFSFSMGLMLWKYCISSIPPAADISMDLFVYMGKNILRWSDGRKHFTFFLTFIIVINGSAKEIF